METEAKHQKIRSDYDTENQEQQTSLDTGEDDTDAVTD